MRKNILLILIFVYYNSFSQDSLTPKKQISFKTFSGWRMDGKRLAMKEFKNEIYKVPAAIPIYNKGTQNRTIGFICIAPLAVFSIASGGPGELSGSGHGKNNTVFLIGAFISSVTATYLLLRSDKQLKKAARIHNENQLVVY